MMEKSLKFKESVYNRILNGERIDVIARDIKCHVDKIHYIVNEVCEIKNSNSRILGRKDEPYYDCEEDYAPTLFYSWFDLSLNEIEFYEKSNY